MGPSSTVVLDPPPAGCVSGWLYGTVNFFGLALVAGIIFVIMLSPPVQKFWIRQIPRLGPRIFVQFIVVVLLIYITNRIVLNWRSKNQYCGERYQVVDVVQTS